MTKPARLIALSVILFIASCALLSYAQAHAQIGPIVIPTPTMLPAPTPSDGDDFVIMWHVVYLPFVEVNHAQ
jgi:hypothetical protein